LEKLHECWRGEGFYKVVNLPSIMPELRTGWEVGKKTQTGKNESHTPGKRGANGKIGERESFRCPVIRATSKWVKIWGWGGRKSSFKGRREGDRTAYYEHLFLATEKEKKKIWIVRSHWENWRIQSRKA